MNGDGDVMVTGRLKDVVNRAGEKINPAEIETFLATHPKVAEVYIVGVPDPVNGEELCAWIRVRAGDAASAEEIRRYCRGEIATFKIPRHVRFTDEFPRTVSGKVQKYRLRERWATAP